MEYVIPPYAVKYPTNSTIAVIIDGLPFYRHIEKFGFRNVPKVNTSLFLLYVPVTRDWKFLEGKTLESL
jgi:hypothetical protein